MSSAKPPRRSIFADKLAAHADFASGDDAAFARRGKWRTFFAHRIGDNFDGRIILEIGCADAATLSAMAAKHPRSGFIGIDWKARQIFLGAQRVASRDQRNVALLRARAQDLRQIFADGEVDEILIFHPEPFDRPEEAANRLVAEPFLIDAHRVLRGEASTISVKTDHRTYHERMLSLFGTEPSEPVEHAPRSGAARERFDVVAHSDDYWNDPAALALTADRCFAGETTLFERRFIRRRQPIFYLEMRRRRLIAPL